MVNSNLIKAAMMPYLRFKRQFDYVATEVGNYSADAAGINNNYLHEYEIKISMSDFKADFKKPKHKAYLDYEKHCKEQQEDIQKTIDWHKENYPGHETPTHITTRFNGIGNFIPNKFSFVVPKSMLEAAEKELKERGLNKYGLMIYRGTEEENAGYSRDLIETHIPAKFLHKNEVNDRVKEIFVARMGSMIANHMETVKLRELNFNEADINAIVNLGQNKPEEEYGDD